ncbi:hypothetical protein BGW38_000560 [Lunasporangiospora selenospora]|uniref:Uncharacterized protein n=1 Tax=Lunasporangiospora selenospora TaxID=979761 RepID=A0A9P6FVB7_9FUNG|nr:hypothetical protein BGW38_000560 [Lunasporangiospora selenospora]
MDSDWCLFCEKHVLELGAAYCSKDCARMDKLVALSNKPSSASTLSSGASSPFSSVAGSPLNPSMKRSVHPPMTMTYPSMFRSSTLVPASISSRGGISKSGYTPIPVSTTNIRCLPASRNSSRRQPLVLYD